MRIGMIGVYRFVGEQGMALTGDGHLIGHKENNNGTAWLGKAGAMTDITMQKDLQHNGEGNRTSVHVFVSTTSLRKTISILDAILIACSPSLVNDIS